MNIIKNKLQYTFILASSFSLLYSCNKFLDVQPKSSISDANTIFDSTSAQEALNGVYASYYYTSFEPIGYLSGDNIQFTGSQSQYSEFINHNVLADNSTIESAWNAIYTSINNINNVITKVLALSNSVISISTQNNIVGQAYFLRGLAYFDLARTWGAAPIITRPTESPSDNNQVRRSDQQKVYAQSLNDLDTAELLLPNTYSVYTATRKTVWALKARFYLYQRNWQQAESYATQALNDNTDYQLISPYSSFFLNNTSATKEAVFYLYHSSSNPNGEYGQWESQQTGGTRQWAPNDAFVSLVNNPDIGGNRNVLVAKDVQGDWYGTLYHRTDGSDPNYVIRIAEVYLIRAEARAEQNELAGALQDLDVVRNRAGVPNSTETSQSDILLGIENENRIEFAYEPHRWYDLVRTDRAATVLNIKDTSHYLMPVPANEIGLDSSLALPPIQ